MTYSEAIKTGFRLINRQWQLVAIHAGVMVINCIGLIIMVGIPLAIAFIIFGIDVVSLINTNDLMGQIGSPAELFTKYFGLVLVVLTSILLYLIVATTIWLYVLGGKAGVIGQSVLDPSLSFSLRLFFGEARKLFFPVMWYSLVMGLIFIALFFILGLLGGGIAIIFSIAQSQDSTLALFLGIFFALTFSLFVLCVVFVLLAVSLYGVAVLFFKGEGAARSVAGAVRFLWNNQQAFWMYILLITGYFIASIALMIIIAPIQMVPFVGAFLSLPLQILLYLFQGYLGLVLIAVIFVYYHNAEIKGPEPLPGIPGDPIDEDSSSFADISVSQDRGQDDPPPVMEAKEVV